MKQKILRFIALFLIELVVFLPFYIADVYAAQPIINNIQVNPSHNSAEITWQTDISSNSIINYGKNSLIELSKSEGDITKNHVVNLGPLSTNTKYYYRIKSCDSGQCSTSSVNSFTTLSAPVLDKITGLKNNTVTTHSIELEWYQSDSNYFGYYIIYRNGEVIENISSKSTTSFLDENLDGATTYLYEVSGANNEGVEGEKSDGLYVTTQTPDTIPPIISNVSISSISSDSITINWMTNENANATIEYGIGSLDLSVGDSSYGLSHSISLNNLENDTSYVYKIVSCDVDKNCAEKTDNEAFVPTEIREINIEMNVPLIYNKATVPVNGEVTPYTKVRFFVNNAYKGLIRSERNREGHIIFDVPGFSSGNNTLKVVVEDSVGNKKEKSYNIIIDLTPPAVDISELPPVTSAESITVNGSSSEPVDIYIYTNLIDSEDTTAPGKIANLHTDYIRENSVELAWNNVEDSDFKEYIIYRNGVVIGTTVASPYEDDYLISSGKSYRYEIVAVDTSCNFGEKAVINVKTLGGGLVYDEAVEPEIVDCLDQGANPDYSLEEQYPVFIEEISLEQGLNEIIIEVKDKAGNMVKEIFKVYYDSEVPEILETNLDVLSPSYIRDVTITGTVSEDSYVCVYVNSDVEVKSYRSSEVNETQDFIHEKKYCGHTIDREFSIDVELSRDPDYALDKDYQSEQTHWMNFKTGSAWSNNIKIVATDQVGLKSDAEEGEIIYSLCGGGGEWSLLIDDIMPTEIVPRHLLEGMAQVGLSLDLKWRGSGDKPGITDIDIIEGYPMGMSSDLEDIFDADWISQIYDDAWSDEYDKGYVLIDLKAQDPYPGDKTKTTYDREKNLSKHHRGECFSMPFSGKISGKDKSYIEEAGCVRIPLTIMINYEKEKKVWDDNRWVPRRETITQKECVDVEILIQPRIPPDVIPSSFLKGSVEALNATIEFIDQVLEPLEQVLKGTMVACFGAWAALYLRKVGEGFSCLGVNIKSCKCEIDETGIFECEGKGEDDDGSLFGKEERCESCIRAKISTKNLERGMHWVCDRIMCPAVPSYEEYIKDNREGSSNCNGLRDAEYDIIEKNQDICKYRPKGLIGPEGPIVVDDNECCDEEYMTEWGPGCVMMNELTESEELAAKREGTGFDVKASNLLKDMWRGLSRFKLCKPGEANRREVNINGQWFIFEKNPAYNEKQAKELGEDYNVFEFDVYAGESVRNRELSNKKLIKDEINIIGGIIDEETGEFRGQKLTGTKITREGCKKYGIDNSYKFNQFWWPKYTTTVYSERTTKGTGIPSFLTESEKTIWKEEEKDFEENEKEETVTKTYDGVDYTYKLDKGKNEYVLSGVEKSGTKIEELVEGSGEDKKTTYKIKDDLVYIRNPKETVESSQREEPVPESIVREACSGFAEDFIINPADNIFTSIQCVCLSSLYAHLKMYRKILGLIKDCFQTILVTGDGSSGTCQAVLSMYVCDILYYMFSCIKGRTGFGTEERSFGVMGFFKGVVGAGAEVQQSVQKRYGTTNMFNVMFVEKKVIHSACMAFFGMDADIDLMGLVEETMEMPIKSTVGIIPARRRFVGYNPVDGITNHVYQVGLMIVSGSDNMRYNAYLVCSSDNSCDSRYFDKNYCDCAYLGKETTVDITNAFGGNGRLDQGEILNQEAYIPISYDNFDARYRYDKVRVEYTYLDNKEGIKTEISEVKLKQVGTEPLAACSFDILAGTYRCAVFEEPVTACITKDPKIEAEGWVKEDGRIYDAVDTELKFKFNAQEQVNERARAKTFFAELKIKDGGKVLARKISEISSEEDLQYSFEPIKIKEKWFGDFTSSYRLITTGKYKDLGISKVEKGTDDLKITSTKNPGDTSATFKVYKGSYSGSFGDMVTCTFSKDVIRANCGHAVITLRSFDSIPEGTHSMVADYDLSTTSSSKTLDYTLTIYRPETDNPRKPSNIVAKCNGVRQIREGEFIIDKEPEGALKMLQREEGIESSEILILRFGDGFYDDEIVHVAWDSDKEKAKVIIKPNGEELHKDWVFSDTIGKLLEGNLYERLYEWEIINPEDESDTLLIEMMEEDIDFVKMILGSENLKDYTKNLNLTISSERVSRELKDIAVQSEEDI